MLDIALKYTDELKKLYINTWHNEKYKYYNYRCYWELPNFEQKSTLDGHDFVSINSKGEVIGAIGYCILRDTESVCGLGIINFTDDQLTFGRDVLQAIKDVFEKYNFRKLSCCVVIGNPIEKTYDRLIPKYGGRIVGIEKEETKLCDNKYYDVKRYEILREDYMRAKDKKCDKKIGCGDDAKSYDSLTHVNKFCMSEEDHEWECCGISTAGSSYICKKCYAHKTVPYTTVVLETHFTSSLKEN